MSPGEVKYDPRLSVFLQNWLTVSVLYETAAYGILFPRGPRAGFGSDGVGFLHA